MKYGKLVNNEAILHSADFPIYNGDGTITLTSDIELLKQNGFKEICYTEPEPPEGFIAESYIWKETDTQIIQEWIYSECIEPEIEKSELEIQVEEMNNTINMLTECILEMSAMIYA